MIAIPDFGAGAMENWGLVTYRETVLLYDEEEASEGWKSLVCTIISHELAHQARNKLFHIDTMNSQESDCSNFQEIFCDFIILTLRTLL